MYSISGSLRRLIPAVLLFLTLAIPIAPARTIYVSPSGVSDGTGESWATAFKTITAGLAASASGDEVWVRSAVYSGPIKMKAGVSLFAGFRGTETIRNERDWNTHQTVIRGGGTVVTGADFATLDGFTLTGGDSRHGGGVSCISTAPTLSNCIIKDNRVFYEERNYYDWGDYTYFFDGCGGGIYCENASPVLNNCVIAGNTSDFGGGVYCSKNSFLVLNACTIRENSAYYSNEHCGDFSCWSESDGYGGGIYCVNSSITMNQCSVEENFTIMGAGMFCSSSNVILNNCRIAGNTASHDFVGSYSSFGAGIYCHNSSFLLSSCVFIGNWTGTAGGGLCCSNSSPLLINCTFSGNTAESSGSGLYCYSSSPTLINCILWNPGNEIRKDSNSNVAVTHSCIEGGWEGEGNISSDPLFVHPWDGSWADLRLQPGSPCINAGSPDVAYNDACLPPGLGGARCDMGAYGGPLNCAGVPEIPTPTPTPMPSPTPTVTPLPTWTPTVTPTATATPKMPPSKEHPQLWLLDGRGKVIIQNAGDRIQNTE